MALIKLSGIVTAISGKMGGTSFGTSASGSYAKNAGTPRKSLTNSQRSKMALMGTTAQRWRMLTQTQRDAFNAASPDYPYLNRVGETKFYSGYAIFTQLVNNLSLNSFSSTPIALPKFSFEPLTGVYLTDLPFDGHLYGQSTQVGVLYRLFASRISSKGISSAYKNQFFIDSALPNEEGSLEIDFSDNYITRFGPEPASGKVFWRVDAIHISTGQMYKGLNSGIYSY